MFKLPHNFTNFTCYKGHAQNPPSQASTVHEPRTSRYTSWIEKMQNQRTNCQHPLDHRKRKRIPAKTFMSASLTMLKSLTVWNWTNGGKLLKWWQYQTTLPASWEIYMQVKKLQLELDMEQGTGSKLGKEHIKAVYCHPAYLTYIHCTSCEMPGWKKHSLESRLPGELSITSDMQMTPSLWQKLKRS